MEERKSVVLMETARTGYGPDQIRGTLTVGDLIELLQDFDEDTEIMFSNDNGYTYGAINWESISYAEYDADGCVYRD